MLTALPKLAYIKANSRPIYPPPTIVSDAGNLSRSIIVSDRYTFLLLSAPGILGIIGVEPVLIINSVPSIPTTPSFVRTFI